MALVLALVLLPLRSHAAVDRATVDFVIDRVTNYYSVPEDLIRRIVACESDFQPEVISRTNDYGLLQINSKAHKKTAKEMGYDIHIWQQSFEYGVLLFKEEGSQPWFMSAKCHKVSYKPKKVA
jgi:soluble lytic murein transglycosylase-like protein